MSSFETDVMEDLYYDQAEGPARHHFDEYDEFDEGESDSYDEYDEMDEYDEFALDEADEYEDTDMLAVMEDAMVDALAAEDSDEFFAERGGHYNGRVKLPEPSGAVLLKLPPLSAVSPVLFRIQRRRQSVGRRQ
jgi:hypothetical protein